MISTLAVNLLGSPFNSELELSDIGLLIVVLLFIARLYQRFNTFEETLAKRITEKQRTAEQGEAVRLLPSPLLTKKADGYVLERRCDEIHQRLDHELQRLAAARKAEYERREGQATVIATLQTATDAQTRALDDMKRQIEETNSRIDAVPERVIRLLRETKGLIP